MDPAEVIEHIDQVMPTLIKEMSVTEDLLRNLKAQKVITWETRDIILAERVNSERVCLLMDDVVRDIKGRFAGLISALRETSQEGVIKALSMTTELGQSPEQQYQQDLDDCISFLKEANIHFAKNMNIFKNYRSLKSTTVNITQLFTKLTLITDFGHGSKEDGTEISLHAALCPSTKKVFFVGDPGSGKSSLALHIVNAWGNGQGLTQSQDPSTDNQHPLNGVKNVIYIRPMECLSTVRETIQEIFRKRCRGKGAAAAQHYDRYPEETAIVLDSLDEIINKDFIKDLFRIMDEDKGLIIGCVRTNHPVLDDLQDSPDHRKIKVEGFSEKHIMEYIELYFKGNSDTIREFRVLLDKEERLKFLFQNPLLTCLVCILVDEGEYCVQGLSGITKIKIYAKIEGLICKREGWDLKDVGENLKNFHKYALLVLMEDKQLFINDLREFNIEPHKIPFVAIEGEVPGKHEKGCKVVWPHRSFIEFSAALHITETDKGLQEALLVYICSQRKMNNILLFLLELIGVDEERLRRLANAVLALQAQVTPVVHFQVPFIHPCDSANNAKWTDELSAIKPTDILCGEKTTVRKVCTKSFRPCPRCWRKLQLISTSEGQAAFQNAHSCIKTLPKDVCEKLVREILTPLSPQTKELLLPVPDTDRYVMVRDCGYDARTIYSNSPEDLVKSGAFHALTGLKLNNLNLSTDQQGDEFSDDHHTADCQEWTRLLHTMIQQGPVIQNILYFTHDNRTSYDGLLEVLPVMLEQLKDYLPGGRIKLTGGSYTWRQVSMFIHTLRQTWDLRPADAGGIDLYTWEGDGVHMLKLELRDSMFTSPIKEEQEEIQTKENLIKHPLPMMYVIISCFAGTFTVPAPDTDRNVKVKYALVYGWNIHSNRPDDIVTSGALHTLSGLKLSRLKLHTDRHGGEYSDDHHRADCQEWTRLLHTMIQQGPVIQNVLYFTHYNMASYDGLLEVLPVMIEQFRDYFTGRRIYLQGGSYSGRQVSMFIHTLRQTLDLRPAEDGGTDLYTWEGDGVHVLKLDLRNPLIISLTTEEQEEARTQVNCIGLSRFPEWRIQE